MPYKKGLLTVKKFFVKKKNAIREKLGRTSEKANPTPPATVDQQILQDITSSSNNYNDLATPLRSTTNAIQNFKDLVSSVDTIDLPCGWALANSDRDSLRIVYLEESENNCTQDPKITKSVTILSDLTWELRILNPAANQDNNRTSQVANICAVSENMLWKSRVQSTRVNCREQSYGW
ncbi:Hypothetical predicted protein [Paramuricea clavata]|uniref:Uncharacterized protein n=1 Tax=Paramuricea clavata TaxID=317549 RepID=A0A7D9EZY4_PARCT|nr:Hypothetical predicted protein [Paramuricea clavata]